MRYTQLELVSNRGNPRIVLCFEDLLLTSQIQITWKGLNKTAYEESVKYEKIKRNILLWIENFSFVSDYNHNKSKYFSVSGEEEDDIIVPTMTDAVLPY